MTRTLPLSLFTLLTLAACDGNVAPGNPDNPDMMQPPDMHKPLPDRSPPPAGKLAVVVPGATQPFTRPLRAAVVWLHAPRATSAQEPPQASVLAVKEDVAVPAGLPSRVLLDVARLALPQPLPGDDGKARTYGSIVVYEDSNRNGRLDLITLNDPKPIDRLVGTADQYRLSYAAHIDNDDNDGVPIFALELVRTPGADQPPPACGTDEPHPEVLPLESVIDVPLDPQRQFPLALCEVQSQFDQCDPDAADAWSCSSDGHGMLLHTRADANTACAHWVTCAVRDCAQDPMCLKF